MNVIRVVIDLRCNLQHSWTKSKPWTFSKCVILMRSQTMQSMPAATMMNGFFQTQLLMKIFCKHFDNDTDMMMLTSSILLAEVGESPDVSKTNTKSENSEEELDRTVPGDPCHTLHIHGVFSKLHHCSYSFSNLETFHFSLASWANSWQSYHRILFLFLFSMSLGIRYCQEAQICM